MTPAPPKTSFTTRSSHYNATPLDYAIPEQQWPTCRNPWSTRRDRRSGAATPSASICASPNPTSASQATPSISTRRIIWLLGTPEDLRRTIGRRPLLAEEHREVYSAVRQLPPRDQQVLALRYWSELSEAEIAAALGISRGTVRSTASRALDKLEAILEAQR